MHGINEEYISEIPFKYLKCYSDSLNCFKDGAEYLEYFQEAEGKENR